MRVLIATLPLLVALAGCGDKADDEDDEGSDGTSDSDGTDGTDGTDGADGADGTDGTDGTERVDADGDGYDEDDDCDDNDEDINPGATEVCDQEDNDCDGDVDEGVTTDWYADSDTDGFGDPATRRAACEPPSGYVADGTDCDDGAIDINTDATEVCDGHDNNCDRNIDEGVTNTFYSDTDGDGFGDATSMVEACEQPSGASTDDTDCDDTDGDTYPGADELCDGIDNDCDATTSDDGQVTLTDSTGANSDVTATMAGDVTISDAGTYTFCDGTFSVNLDLDADVTLTSGAGAATTILDGGNAGTVVEVADGITVAITDLTIANGTADATYRNGTAGGGVHCSGTSTLDVTDAIFTGNYARLGGGLYSEGCTTTVTDTTFDTNNASYGAAVGLRNGDATLSNCTGTNNTADVSGGFTYVSAYLSDSTLEILGGTIDANFASGAAAIYIDGNDTGDAHVLCDTATVTNNDGDAYGAAYVSEDNATLRSIDCDWGTSDNADDNTNYDVTTDSDNDYDDFGERAWFECDGNGCDIGVDFEGATGTYRAIDGYSATVGSYDCDITWDLVGASTSSWCDDCVFAFATTWTIDTSTALTTNCSYTPTDFSYGIGLVMDPALYSSPVVYLEHDGSWLPYWYATWADGTATASGGNLDYPTTYYGTTYYETEYFVFEMTPY